jgi:hypothetical protein
MKRIGTFVWPILLLNLVLSAGCGSPTATPITKSFTIPVPPLPSDTPVSYHGSPIRAFHPGTHSSDRAASWSDFTSNPSVDLQISADFSQLRSPEEAAARTEIVALDPYVFSSSTWFIQYYQVTVVAAMSDGRVLEGSSTFRFRGLLEKVLDDPKFRGLMAEAIRDAIGDLHEWRFESKPGHPDLPTPSP